MSQTDVIVIGAGISGLAFAFKAAKAGKQVLLLESEEQVGGCIRSPSNGDGHWYELGAHTVYNSYGGFLEIAEGTGAIDQLVERGPARKTFGFLRDNDITWLTPPKILLQLNWFEVLWNGPFGMLRSKEGRTMAEYYGGLIGSGNFGRVLSPFLAAVPSQSADSFPAAGPGSLFKKRPRREDIVRSFGFNGGLQVVCDSAAAAPGVSVRTATTVTCIEATDDGYKVVTDSGEELFAPLLAMATPPHVTTALLAQTAPELSKAIGQVGTIDVDSVGVTLSSEQCSLPPCAFVVPNSDIFHSAVTRDPFPDDKKRSFAFHFRPGNAREKRIERVGEVLGVPTDELGTLDERSLTLPAPVMGHDKIVADIDAALTGLSIAVTGNYFDGLAIEDCVQRSFSEWARLEN